MDDEKIKGIPKNIYMIKVNKNNIQISWKGKNGINFEGLGKQIYTRSFLIEGEKVDYFNSPKITVFEIE